jgi:hypothetical protein
MFSSVDILDFSRQNVVNHGIEKNIKYTFICVGKRFFETDLMVGFGSFDEARRQCELDIPRSLFYYNGVRQSRVPEQMCWKLYPFCTQSVMALPVEILTNHGVVCECGSPLFIHVCDRNQTTFYASKELDICRNSPEDNYRFRVMTHISMVDDDVSIEFTFRSHETQSTNILSSSTRKIAGCNTAYG